MAAKITPFINIGPGQVINRNLTALNWTNRDLAEVIGLSEKSVSQIINNKQSITIDTAILLGKAFNTSPEFWLNLEQNYQLRKKAEAIQDTGTILKAKIRSFMPLLEMKKKTWIHYDNSSETQIEAYKKFWGLNELDFSQYTDSKSLLPFFARKSKNEDSLTLYNSITWFRKASIEAEKRKVKLYDKKKLESLLSSITEYTVMSDGPENYIRELLSCGVKFFVLSHLCKTYLDGASFFDGRNPVIVYTARHDRVDNFWWTMAHEAVHVLMHIKDETDCFLDNFDDRNDISKQEAEADEATAHIFKVDKIIEMADQYKKYFTKERLNRIADAFSLSPSLVLGILQHQKIIDWRALTEVKEKVRHFIPAEHYVKEDGF